MFIVDRMATSIWPPSDGGTKFSKRLDSVTMWGLKVAIKGTAVTCAADCALRALGASLTVRIAFFTIPATVGLVGLSAAILGGVSYVALNHFASKHEGANVSSSSHVKKTHDE